MPIPTIDGELFSSAGYNFQEPSDKYPLGRWVPPAGAKTAGISAVGAPAYCEHPSTEVLTVSYDLVDGRGVRRWKPGEVLPWDLMNHLTDPTAPIEAHNALFERLWVEKVAARLYGWPIPDASKWRCSMATALVAQRPGALGNLGDVLGLTEKKDKEGDRLIKKFCIPQQPIVGLIDRKTGAVKRPDQPARRIYPHDDPKDFERLRAYCDQDVRTEMAAMERLPPLSDRELEAWQFTTDQNYRGMAVDREGLRSCINILNQVLERYGQECRDLTGFNVTQIAKLKEWVADRGLLLPDFKAATLKDFLAGEFTETFDLTDEEESEDDPLLAEYLASKKGSAGDNAPQGVHPDARRVVELRALTGSASVKKTLAIESRCSTDNRLRDIVVHHGTRPGRPTGQGPQPLNLPKAGPKLAWCQCGRPSLPAPTCPWCGEIQPRAPRTAWQSGMVDHVLEIMSFGSLDLVEQFYGDAMTAIQGCVRGLFVAGPGRQLVSTDYSSLQAVVLACLSGEQWRIDAFKRNDPIYLLGASKITGKPLQFYLDWFLEHGDHHPDRQYIGKVSELACLSGDTFVWARRHGVRRSFGEWTRLADITLDHRVWDGLRFVRHDGLISRGVKEVQMRAGIAATPDHEFFIDGKKTRFDRMTIFDWPIAAREVLPLPVAAPILPTASKLFVETYDLLNCGPNHRFTVASAYGPVLASNCGFQGWIGSYRAFGSIEEDSVIRKQILAWRDASPAIVEMWGGQHRGPPWRRERAELYGLEGMFIAAVQNPGQPFTFRGITFQYDPAADCLEMLLPPCDGHRRPLRYHEPRLTPSARNPDELAISYMTWNTNVNYGARGWIRMPTWGGRLTENAVMGVEVDIQRYGAKLMAAAGYPLVLAVYDENVAEVPIGKPLTLGLPPVEGLDPHVQEIEHLLGIMPPELADWPIRASGGWTGRRYRKG